MLGSAAPERLRAGHNGDGMDELNVEVAHAIQGRVRLRIVELKSQPDLAGQLKSRLKSLPQLNSLEVNPQSASVILRYEPVAESSFTALLAVTFPLTTW